MSKARLRILIVEDDDNLSALYGAIVEKECGAELIFAVSSHSALKAIREERVDVIILDLRIPGDPEDEFPGMVVARTALRMDRLRPVIIVTGYASLGLARSAFTEGVFDFIEKGMDTPTQLVVACDKALTFRRTQLLRLQNPFSMIGGPPSKIFSGRERELQFLEERLQRTMNGIGPDNFILVGDVGVGKTSILTEFKNACLLRECAVAVVPASPLPEGLSAEDAVRSLVQLITRALPFPRSTFKQLNEYLGSVGLSLFGAEIRFDKPVSDPVFALPLLIDSLTSLAEDIKGKSKQLVILIDDIDNWFASPEAISVIQQAVQIDKIRATGTLFGFTSSIRRWSELQITEGGRALVRSIGSRRFLSTLRPDEIRLMINTALRGTGICFDDELFDAIIDWSKGHPAKAQCICYHLFDNQFAARVGIEMWEKACLLAEEDIDHAGLEGQAEGTKPKAEPKGSG